MKRTALLVMALLILPTKARALDAHDILSLVAMPLAVAAVADLTGVPSADLGNFVGSLNQANVQPVQVIEVLRYVPVALVVQEPTQTAFVPWVQQQVISGVTGNQLVTVIERRMPEYGIAPSFDYTLTAPREIFAPDYFPVVVRTRVTQLQTYPNQSYPDRTYRTYPERTQIVDRVYTTDRTHPHGGPPGQLKKERGLQTGAEVVHGSRSSAPVYVERERHPAKAPKASKAPHGNKHESIRQPAVVRVAPQQRVVVQGHGNDGHGNGGGHGKGGGHGNGGHGKGKG